MREPVGISRKESILYLGTMVRKTHRHAPNYYAIYSRNRFLFVVVLGMLAEMVQETRHSAPKTSALASQKTRLPITIALIVLSWLALTGVLAYTGFFHLQPARLRLFIIPPVVFIFGLAFTRIADPLLRVVRPERFMEAQGFRILVEIILLILFAQKRIASLMTFEGRNWDIIAGILLPFVAFLCFRAKALAPLVAVYANFFGLTSLLNTAAHGVLSQPGMMAVFKTRPPFGIVQEFPFIWLPLFLVPLGILLHALSLRQLIVIQKVFASSASRNGAV